MNNTYIVTGYRTAVGKAKKGGFRFTRPDDLAIRVIKEMMSKYPQIEASEVDDVIVGCAIPEAEQALNMGRMIALGALSINVPGMLVNRYCASGIESIVIGLTRIQCGYADCIIAGGAESMSLVPVPGWKTVPNPEMAKKFPDWYYNMGLTAEEVADRYKISREDQDEFALNSHKKAVKATEKGNFKDDIVAVDIEENSYINGEKHSKKYSVDTDEGPRKDTSAEALSSLKPVFKSNGSVTAGNSSQTSDGAAFVLLMSESFMKKKKLEPKARLAAYAVSGVEPAIMGIGPVEAIPKAIRFAGLKKKDISQIELNEAFASQSLAVIRELELDPDIVNVNGGAIALGHPLGCTGAKLTVQLMREMKNRKQKYGILSMCVGGGQGAAAVIERMG